MAKPTKRILDWASSGNAVDPGASKEANGWFIAERPPAYWWNWILQSIGDWLSYFETETDLRLPVAYGTVVTVNAGSATVTANSYNVTTPIKTSTSVEVPFLSAQASGDYCVVVTSSNGSIDQVARVTVKATSGFIFEIRDISSDTIVNPNSFSTETDFVVFGSG